MVKLRRVPRGVRQGHYEIRLRAIQKVNEPRRSYEFIESFGRAAACRQEGQSRQQSLPLSIAKVIRPVVATVIRPP